MGKEIDKGNYLPAMERSPMKDIEIKHLSRNALTDEIHSCEIYMKGIDYSYFYEGIYYLQDNRNVSRVESSIVAALYGEIKC